MSEAELYEKTLEAVMKMRVSEMKKELDLLKVDSRGFFEKGDFAQALARARLDPGEQMESSGGLTLHWQEDLILRLAAASTCAVSSVPLSCRLPSPSCMYRSMASDTCMVRGTDCGSQPWQ
jgi:hypothetical protein